MSEEGEMESVLVVLLVFQSVKFVYVINVIKEWVLECEMEKTRILRVVIKEWVLECEIEKTSIVIHMQSYENQNACETEYRIRFKTVWNGFCIPFHKKNCKFFYETEYRIRFINTETDSVFRFIKKLYRNGFCIPFHKKIQKRILYSVS